MGRHIAVQAIAAGHEVTFFNRGATTSPTDLLRRHEGRIAHIPGDRNADIGLLSNREWDVAIDCCAYFPKQVIQSANVLNGRCAHYMLVSSISAYQPLYRADLDETHPLSEMTARSGLELNDQTYGPLKARCEHELQRHFTGAITIVRPGFVVGKWDPTNRFNRWLAKLGNEQELLVPEGLDTPFQIVDARDLSAWMIRLAEDCLMGIFNAVGPNAPYSWGEWLAVAKDYLNSNADFKPISEAEMTRGGHSIAEEWPLWIPGLLGSPGFHSVCNNRAISAGLTFLSLKATIADCKSDLCLSSTC